MKYRRQFQRWMLALVLALVAAVRAASVGGSANAFRTLVVVNTQSVDSVELGSYYADVHGIPDHHICSLSMATNLYSVTSNQFLSLIHNPIQSHICSNGLSGQIDYLVLCQDLPTQVEGDESVPASLFYGFKNALTYFEAGHCLLAHGTANDYYQAEETFRSTNDWNNCNGFIAFHLIASDLVTAKAVADRGAAAQSTFPASTINLHMIGSPTRSVREVFYAGTQLSFTTLPGLVPDCVLAPLYSDMSGVTNVIGYQDGYATISLIVQTNNIWMAGAYADHLTSYGGTIPSVGHSTVLDWMDIGATASYGTVNEPCNYTEKFPHPLVGFYYARGFTIGEAYTMAVQAPYQGLFAGDPLAAPFAAPPVTTCSSHTPDQIVTGTVQVAVSAIARSNGVPAASLAVYLDEQFHTNLTSIAPTPGNRLSVTVGTRTNTATVVAGDSLSEAISRLVHAINNDACQSVFATARGDRLRLIHKAYDYAGDPLPVTASVSTGGAAILTLDVGLASANLYPYICPTRKQLLLYTNTRSSSFMDDNPYDVRPRASILFHVTPTNAVLADTLPLNTTELSDGQHTLDFIARDGSAVAAPSRFNLPLIICNSSPQLTLQGTNGAAVTNGERASLDNGTDFGDRKWNQAVTNIFSLHNNGTAALTITAWTTNGTGAEAFQFSGIPSVVEAGGTSNCTVIFTAATSILYEASLSITSDAIIPQTHLLFAGSGRSYTLTVQSAYGTATPSAGVHTNIEGGIVLTNSISVPSPVGGTQLVCTGWSLLDHDPASGSAAHFEMAVTNDATLTWLWATNYRLEPTAGDHGSINVSDSWQPAGSITQLTVTAALYYHFTHWSGDVSSTNNPLVLRMDAPQSVHANFGDMLAVHETPEWWLAAHGWTTNFDAAATKDPDNDGYFTWQEYVCDTDPTNPASVFLPMHANGSGTNLTFTFFQTSTGRTYSLDLTSAPITNPAWSSVTSSIGNGSNWTLQFTPPGTGFHLYRGTVSHTP
jgi:uncharacterized protein (TIGR03790 family)